MESWLPLFDIFLNSPSPEVEASIWLQQSSRASSSTTKSSITTSSFLSLLSKATDAITRSPSLTSSPKRVMLMETLPSAVQSRILSFLLLDRRRFCARDLCNLARNLIGSSRSLDFWVDKGARNLLDVLSDSGYEGISCFNLESAEDRSEEEEAFFSLPSCLKDALDNLDSDSKNKFIIGDSVLPWLPMSLIDLHSRETFVHSGQDSNEDEEESSEYNTNPIIRSTVEPQNVPLDPQIQEVAGSIRSQLQTFGSSSRIISLANEIRNLFEKTGDASGVLVLIQPWEADDETASVLITRLSDGVDDGIETLILSSIIFPKLRSLKTPPSRMLLTTTLQFCNLHQSASVYALLLPLIFQIEGIQGPAGDVVSKIITECLHPGHVSAFFHNLLCGKEIGEQIICLPCHRDLVSNKLVMTEALFAVFQIVLNRDILLTHDSILRLVRCVEESACGFSKSLRFGNFLLYFVSRCSSWLRPHKSLLNRAVKLTDTLVTRSILSKLATL